MINNKKEFKMIQKLKHLKYFSNYIAEQEFADAQADPNAPVAQAAPKDPAYSFIFIEDGEEGDYKYPDGSSSKRFNTYEILKSALEKWLSKNIEGKAAETKQKSIMEYISGVKNSVTPDDKEIVDKFKNAITTEMEGKQSQDTEVIFSKGDNKPTTDVVDVTFILTSKQRK